MDISAQRSLTQITPEWSMAQILKALSDSLSGSGPAITFSKLPYTHVPSECALVVETTGSTGQPKRVALSASALISSAQAAHQRIGALPGERWSLLLPTEHIAGINVLVRSLVLGSEPIDNRNGGKLEEADYVAIVPTQLHRALNSDSQLLSHLQGAKKVLVGGAATNDVLVAQAQAANISIVTTYGMSEMCGGCVYDGVPLDGVNVRVNPSGLIQLSGPMQASTYLGQESDWDQLCQDGWFTTSDLGEFDVGKLTVFSRNDDVINTGGKKVSLISVENAAQHLYPKINFVALAQTDPEWGEKLILVSDDEFDVNAIKLALREKLGAHAVPKDFHVLTAIPYKGIGKPDRIAIKELLSEGRSANL